MADKGNRYLVTDWGYQVLDMETGELFANELPRQWVNMTQQGVVAMERVNANRDAALVDLGEAWVNQKHPLGEKTTGGTNTGKK